MEQLADAAVAGVAAVGYDEWQCRMCGKRQSPSWSNTCDAEMEPRTKKAMLDNPHPLRSSDSSLTGYSEIKLPIDFNTAMNLAPASDSPLLRRCVSDPYNSPGDVNKSNNGGGLESDGPLRRCISDPCHPPGVMPKNQAAGHASGTSGSPARGMSPSGGLPPLYPGSSRMSTDVTPPKVPVDCLTGQSPDSLRLKRMKERMKEMAQWWVAVVREDDETPDEENHNAAAASQDVSEKEAEEEQVSVEKIGDGLKIKLRCPCESGYELLISGHCCYYKIL